MSNKKQTAVSWLVDWLNKMQNSECRISYVDAIKHAKELEKQQIKDAMTAQAETYTYAYRDEYNQPRLSYDIDDSFNDYFTETYGE